MNVPTLLASGVCVCALLSPTQGFSGNVTLQFDSLPSAQGWFYDLAGNRTAESSVFSIQNGYLHQDTMSIGFEGSGNNCYDITNQINPLAPFVLSMRVRMLADSIPNPPPYPNYTNRAGFACVIFTTNCAFYIEFGGGIVGDIERHSLATYDYGTFHDYRVEGDFRTNSFRLFVDGQFSTTGTNLPGQGAYNLISLGDMTGGANASADISGFQFWQPSTSIKMFADMSAGVTIDDAVGLKYRLDSTTNLSNTNWITLTNVTLPVQPYTFIDSRSIGLSKRFYRAVPTP